MFNPIQILLVVIIAFIAGIDQFSFLESLYQPIVTGPIVGAILGDLQTGLIIGGSYQLMMIGSMPVGGAQPPNSVIGGIMAVVLAITSGVKDPEAALGLSIPFALLGQYCVIMMFTITSPLMSKADEYAHNADTGAIEKLNYLTMGGIGLLFALVVLLGMVSGSVISSFLDSVPAWIWTGLGAAGGMMRFVGFAVLMKVMISRDYWGFFLAGFALSNILATTLAAQTLAIVAIIGFAIAFYDYQINTKMKTAGGSVKGDMEDGI